MKETIKQMKMKAIGKTTEMHDNEIAYIVEFHSKQGPCIEMFRNKLEWDKIELGKDYWLVIEKRGEAI